VPSARTAPSREMSAGVGVAGVGPPAEVLIVSLGSTSGLRVADEELRASLARAGARAALVSARAPRPTRTFALTDLAWARAARAAALRARASFPGGAPPPAVI